MENSLVGGQEHKVDEKGRVAIPPELKADLGPLVYISCLTKQCLYVYSVSEWTKLSAKFDEVRLSDEKGQRELRMITANTCKREPDKQGRVLIPQMFRDKVGIKKEVMVMGVSNRVEIWAKDKWEAYSEEKEEKDEGLEVLKSYGI